MVNVELSIFQIIGIGLFGFVFGGFETTTNVFYLLTKNYDLPRKQHGRELPADVTDPEILHKVVQMLSLGIILLVIATIAIVIAPQLFVVGAAAIFVNGLIDYSKFKKRDILILWITIASIACIFSLMTTV